MSDPNNSTSKRHRRRRDEPRTCRFREENGEVHGIVLTPDNSYKTSLYCKEHHAVMVQRSRSTSEEARKGNIRRVTEYKEKNKEAINLHRRELRAAKPLEQAGMSRDEALAIVRERMARQPPEPPEPPPEPPKPKRHRRREGEPRSCGFVMPDGSRHGIELTEANSYTSSRYCKEHHTVMVQRARQGDPPPMIDRCFRPATSRKWHAAGDRSMSLCSNWRTPPDTELTSRRLDDPDLCAMCRRRHLVKTAKDDKR
jgi:hypothetical protein